VGTFSAKFSTTIEAKLLMGSKKLGGLNDGTNFLYRHAKFGGNRTMQVGMKRHYCVMFSVSLFVTLMAIDGPR